MNDESNGYLTYKTAAAFFIVSLLAMGLLGWAVSHNVSTSVSKDRAEDLIDAEIASCERDTLDRVDNARAWTEVERLLGRLSKTSNSEASREELANSRILVGETANQLRTRILFCEPLIRRNRHIIDERLLREAQGDL